MAQKHVVHIEENLDVPEVVVMRLPQYLRVLVALAEEGAEVVNSEQLGLRIETTPAQIRKDFSYFGRFGKQGRGYSVQYLLAKLRQILKLDNEWKVGLIGVGRLGRAILSYQGFAPAGFKVIAAFDSDPRQVGQMVGGIMVQPMHRIQEVVQGTDIRIGIVAVPATEVQGVVDQLVECNVRAIVNYAPVTVHTPQNVKVRNVDPVLALQSMTFYLP